MKQMVPVCISENNHSAINEYFCWELFTQEAPLGILLTHNSTHMIAEKSNLDWAAHRKAPWKVRQKIGLLLELFP